MKRFAFFLLLISFPFSSIFATNHSGLNGYENIESWLLSAPVGDNSLSIFFDISTVEFSDYVTSNNVETLTLDFYWQSNNGSIQQSIGSEIVNVGLVDIEQWTYLIENADYTTGQYFAQVTINNEDCGLSIPIPIETVDDDDEDPVDLPIELPSFECGEDFTLEPVTNTSLLASANIGDIFYIGGFPILVTDVSGTNGVFSGQGIIPLPFKNKAVQVSFSGVKVNTDKAIFDGEVVGNSNGVPIVPSSDTLDIGGQICLPNPPPEGQGPNGYDEVTGLDDWGFDSLGINAETQTPYDPNGFDVNGNHINGTPYNDYGCNRDGLNEQNQPCDPSAGSNEAASVFADSLSATFNTTVTDYIGAVKTGILDSINALNCGGIRQSMDAIVVKAKYDRKFVFGDGDKYFKKGMHKFFAKKPERMVLNITRDENATNLEAQHIDLYVCDKKEYALDTILVVLNSLNADSLTTLLLARIKNWTEYEYGLYHNDPVKFKDWVLRQIGDILKSDTGLDNSYFYTNVEDHDLRFRDNFLNDIEYRDIVTASLDDGSMAGSQYTEEEKEIYRLLLSEGKEQLKRNYQAIPPNLPDSLSVLPIIKSKTVGNKTYKIVITRIVFLPNGARLDAHMEIIDQNTNKKLVFAGENIPFGPTGLEGGESARLYLGTPVQIRLNNVSRLILKQGPGTYVAWDCNGFSGMGIDAEIEFCRNYIIPLDDQLKPKPDSVRYRLPIQLEDITWLEFSMTITDAPPFAVAGYEDVKWKLTGMVVDFSSSSTPQFTPMEGYASPFWDGSTMSPAWKGFYMKNLSATLPKSLAGSDSSEELVIQASDILIDSRGFTGMVKAPANILSFEDGNLGGWPFSIDGFSLSILNNHFAGAGFNGEINVPIFKEKLKYEAVMYPESKYEFKVTPGGEMTMDMFLAKATLEDNSSISIRYDVPTEEFVAIATLNGKLEAKTNNNNSMQLKLPQMTFNGFKVSNGKGGNKYFEAGNWGVDSLSSLGVSFQLNGFGLSIHDILPVGTDNSDEAALGITLDVKLVKDVSATGRFNIIGKLEENNGRQKWVYDRLKLEHLKVDATFKGENHIFGLLQWYENDTEWGSGFRGLVDADFNKIGLSVKAAAQFGKKNNATGKEYKYFFVDALVNTNKIPSVGPLKLTGFGGGISYRMSMDAANVNLENVAGDTLPPLGISFSGTKYTPDDYYGLGLKATVAVALQKETLFNGVVSLAFMFKNGGGLESISIQGSGHFLQDVNLGIKPDTIKNKNLAIDDAEPGPSSVGAPLTAFIDLEMNFTNKSFHGTLFSYLNMNYLHGSGNNNKLVNAEIYFDKSKWFIKVGGPEEKDRCGVALSTFLGGIKATAYFQVGTEVDPMALPPHQVTDVVGPMPTNELLRRSGQGIVFGFAVQVAFHGHVGPVSVDAEAGAGFDAMLKRYSDVSCGDYSPIGFDGWYAVGQVWVYGSAKVKVRKWTLFDVSVAAILQMRGPKPFHLDGRVGVRYRLFGKYRNKTVSVSVGDDCAFVSSGGGSSDDGIGMDVILALTPGDEEQNVDPLFSSMNASLAIPLDKVISVPTGINQSADFEVKLDNISLVSGSEGNIEINYSDNGSLISITPAYELPWNDSLVLSVTVKIFKNGVLSTTQTKTSTFFTGEGLNSIPAYNVQSSYPFDGMVNYYKKEFLPGGKPKGYVKLKQGQGHLLLTGIPDGYEQKIRFTSANGNSFYQDYEYDYWNKTISFEIPESSLAGDDIYKLEIVRKQISSDGFTSNSTTSSSSGDFSAAMSKKTFSPPSSKSNSNVGSNAAETILYSLFFRVSNYDTFRDKVNAIMNSGSGNSRDVKSVELFGDKELDSYIEISATIYNLKSANQSSIVVMKDVASDYTSDTNPLDYLDFENIFKDLVFNGFHIDTESDMSLVINSDTYSSGKIGAGVNAQTLRNDFWHMAVNEFFFYQNAIINELNAIIAENNCDCGTAIHPKGDYAEGDPDCIGPCKNMEKMDMIPIKPNGVISSAKIKYYLPNGKLSSIVDLNF